MTLDVLRELQQVGAVITGRHFVYTSGKHGSAYINSDPLFPHVDLVRQFCDLLVEPFRGRVDTVAAPATGGIVLSILSGAAFTDKGEKVSAVWADKDGSDFVFERAGFSDQIHNKRVLVVEDMLNTGGSVEKVCRLVERHGGELVGVSVIGNRGASTSESLRVPQLESLATVKMDAWDADACPLCADEIAIVDDLAHGDTYKQSHPKYAGGFVSLLS